MGTRNDLTTADKRCTLLTEIFATYGRNITFVASFLNASPYVWDAKADWLGVKKFTVGQKFQWYLNSTFMVLYVILCVSPVAYSAVTRATLYEIAVGIFVASLNFVCLVFHDAIAKRPERVECLVRNCVTISSGYCEKNVVADARVPKSIVIIASVVRMFLYATAGNMVSIIVALVTIFPPKSTAMSAFVANELLMLSTDPFVTSCMDVALTTYFYYLAWCTILTFLNVVSIGVAPVIAIIGEFRSPKISKPGEQNMTNMLKTYWKLQTLNSLFNRNFGSTFPKLQFMLIFQMVVGTYAGVRTGGFLGGVLVLIGLVSLIYLILICSGLAVVGTQTQALLLDWKRRAGGKNSLLVTKQLKCLQPLWIRTPFYFIDKQIILTMMEIVITTIFNALILGRTKT